MRVTFKQKRMLDAVEQLSVQLGKPPVLAELRDELHYANTSSVQRHVEALIRKGLLVKEPNCARSLSLTELAEDVQIEATYQVPDSPPHRTRRQELEQALMRAVRNLEPVDLDEVILLAQFMRVRNRKRRETHEDKR